MLRDEANDRHRQPMLVPQVDPILDVRRDDPRARLRVEVVVNIPRARLVLDEGEWILHFADVVVVRRHPHKERVSPDRLCRALAKVAHHDRVVVGARRLEQQPA